MKLIDAFRINARKLQFKTSKAFFLIVPITVLVALSIIISSQVKNFQTATDESIFGEIAEQSTVLEVVNQVETPEEFGETRRFNFNQSQFTETDLNTVKSIENVENASLNYSLPISNIKTTNLFSDTTISLRELNSLNETMASLYTSEDFNYIEGEPIPIILNANTFTETYEDWGEKSEISIEMQRPQEGTDRQDMRNQTPVKTRAVDYNKDDLIGKEFTLTFGGFPDVTDYKTDFSMGTITFTKLTQKEINTLEEERKDAISQYWNYTDLKKGNTYTFKVIGLIESEQTRSTFIPEAFANQVMSDYINLQLKSRNDTAINSDLLNTTYTGLTYNGTELSNNGSGFITRGFDGGPRTFGMQSQDSQSETYAIPGLVIEVSEDDSSDVIGIYSDKNVFNDTTKTGDTLSVKVNDVYNRSQVVNDLNDLGYAYQDVNKLNVFNKVQSTLHRISIGLIISFIVLTIAVIILTMSKFVSESKKEIGIFRAVGFTKGNIITIFLSQSLLYTIVGYILGVITGIIGNILASSFVHTWFNNFVSDTIQETFNVVNEINSNIFTRIDISSIGILSIVLLIVTIIISFIPALRASHISPVEAIKSE